MSDIERKRWSRRKEKTREGRVVDVRVEEGGRKGQRRWVSDKGGREGERVSVQIRRGKEKAKETSCNYTTYLITTQSPLS